LQGAADVTIANAQYYQIIEQARIIRAQADREALLTRRATLEQQDYERREWLKYHDPDTVRRQDQERDLRRSLNDPPPTEIWSGQALNALFNDIQRAETSGARAPSVPLNTDMLARINLTTGTTFRGAGMLRDLTRFNWPLGLRRSAYQKDRQQIEELARTAVEQVMSGNLDFDVVQKLDDAVNSLTSTLKDSTPDMTPTQYIQATRFLRELRESLKVLQDPNVANYFNSKWKARGATVAELVQNMSSQGLRFAPAASGDEAAYTALHRALVTYAFRLRQVAGL
jgi:hypothetical protein